MKQNKMRNIFNAVLFSLFLFTANSCGDNSDSPLRIGCANCKIFVTAATTTGNVGDLTKADLICENDANYPGTGTYKAMIVYTDGSRRACSTANCSNGGISENVNWVLRANTTYSRIDGTTVIGTTTDAGIFTFPLSNSFSATPGNAWMGTFTDWTTGTDDDTCTNWTTGTGSAPPLGLTAKLDYTNMVSISFGLNCSSIRSLLCVEQ